MMKLVTRPIGKIARMHRLKLDDMISINNLKFKLYMLIKLANNIGGNCEKKSFNVKFINKCLPKNSLNRFTPFIIFDKGIVSR